MFHLKAVLLFSFVCSVDILHRIQPSIRIWFADYHADVWTNSSKYLSIQNPDPCFGILQKKENCPRVCALKFSHGIKNRVGKEDSNCNRNCTAVFAQPSNSHGFQIYRQLYGIDFIQELGCVLLGPRWGEKLLIYFSILLLVAVEQIFKFLTVHVSTSNSLRNTERILIKFG